MPVAVTLHDVVYWAGLPISLVAGSLIQRALVRRGWDLPRWRSDRLPTFGLLAIWIGVVQGIWTVGVIGVGFFALYALAYRRWPAKLGTVTSRRGEEAVERYLHSISSTVLTVADQITRSDADQFELPMIGRYERRGDRWTATLTTGRTVTFVLLPDRRAEFRPEDVARHEGDPKGWSDVSLGDLHTALAAMAERGVVDRGRPGWYTVAVR